MNIKYIRLIILLIVLFLVATGAVYTVDVDKVAIITQFGKVVGPPREPGLRFKIPFIQEAYHYSVRRIYQWNHEIYKIKTLDNKYIQVSPKVNWRIIDAIKFYKTVYSVETTVARLDDLFYTTIENSLCIYKLSEIENDHTEKTEDGIFLGPEINDDIMAQCRSRFSKYGIEIITLEIKVESFYQTL